MAKVFSTLFANPRHVALVFVACCDPEQQEGSPRTNIAGINTRDRASSLKISAFESRNKTDLQRLSPFDAEAIGRGDLRSSVLRWRGEKFAELA